MTKQVKIQVTEGGQKYFSIYEVRVKDYTGETHTYDRYLSTFSLFAIAEYTRKHTK